MIPFLFFFCFFCGDSQHVELAQAMIDTGLADAEHITELHDARTGLRKARLCRLTQAVRQRRESPVLPLQHFDVMELAPRCRAVSIARRPATIWSSSPAATALATCSTR